MKKILALTGILGTSLSSFAITYEYPYLYKDPRALGMGNTYIAVGGTSSSVFYNPAGLAKINPEAGFEVDLINMTGAFGKNSINFFKDLQDAIDAKDGDYIQPPDGDDGDDQAYAINQVIDKYQGENLYLEINNYSSISKKREKLGFTIGILGSVINNTIPHQGFGSDGVIEEHLKITYGVVLGLSYDFLDGNINTGLSLKYMYRKAVDHYYTTREIIEQQDNLGDYTLNVLAKDGSAFGGDFGIIYNFNNLKSIEILDLLNPSVGISVLNIGDLDFGDAGKIPMTINTGIAIKPKIPIFNWTFALDYVDITKQFDDKDIGKRLRTGMEVKLLDNKWTSLTLRAGMYQSYPTFGAEVRLALIRANFTMYSEEIGAYAGQKRDDRYLINIGIGW